MMKFLIFSIMMNTLIIYFMKNPLSMGLILLIQTILISLISGMISMTFWYSYMLFLIFMGSMLILFIYICSLISNKKFLFNKMIMMMMFLYMILFMLMLYNKNFNYMNSIDLNLFSNMELFENFNIKMSMNKLFNNPVYKLSIMMMNYLFMTLLIVVKISNINLGSLRKTF
uniref:NADH dehydrogenase subunit 6 n=1 Tax=Augomonoctenus smithi TaxID=1519147 RepID=UPI0023F01D3A|nr:NADH dehydrogenase subunit 6 [Augomonoctenus smithi]WDY84677.1 NADH dehydrogenase subunit 6 [Augomonoctenus smithi]